MRAAVVGTGFGCRVHVPSLRAAGFEVVSLVGRDPERTERRATRLGVPHACSSLGEALSIGVDAVTIATPPDTHAALSLEAIAAGAHVLCEKPFAMSVDEATEMTTAATHAGLVGLVGHEFRFSPQQALVARLLAQGVIGKPRLAVLTQLLPLVADPNANMPGWWFDPSRGGGWLGASGSHELDRVRHWFGDIDVKNVDGLVLKPDRRAEDTFVVRLRTNGDCVVEVVQSAAAWGPAVSMCRIAGDAGSLWLDGADVVVASAADPQGSTVPLPSDLLLPPAPEVSDDPRHRFTHLELGPYTRMCERFAAAIGGGDPTWAATFADGLATQRILDVIRSRSTS